MRAAGLPDGRPDNDSTGKFQPSRPKPSDFQMTTTTIRVDLELFKRVESQKPNYLSTAAFFQLLAEQALNNCELLQLSQCASAKPD